MGSHTRMNSQTSLMLPLGNPKSSWRGKKEGFKKPSRSCFWILHALGELNWNWLALGFSKFVFKTVHAFSCGFFKLTPRLRKLVSERTQWPHFLKTWVGCSKSGKRKLISVGFSDSNFYSPLFTCHWVYETFCNRIFFKCQNHVKTVELYHRRLSPKEPPKLVLGTYGFMKKDIANLSQKFQKN